VINPRDAIVYKSSPEMQIVGYLQAAGLSWGVLTNGIQCRLYHGDALGKTKRYYSVNLMRTLESKAKEEFRRFYLFFRKEAFIEKSAERQNFLDRVLSESEAYGPRVGEELKRVVFEDLFPGLANGFLAYFQNELKLPIDQEVLAA
jgi:hypothetical protein